MQESFPRISPEYSHVSAVRSFGWAKPDAPVGNEIEITLLIEGVKNSPDFKPW